MNEEEKKIKEAELHWRLRFNLVLSTLIIFFVVYYLPTRFLFNASTEDHHDDTATVEHAHEDDGHAHDDDLPTATDIRKLRPRVEGDKIKGDLPYDLKNGVKEFRLTVEEFRWEYQSGKWVHVWGYNGQIPGPTIRVVEGDRIRVIVKNNLPKDATSVHWHGLDLEYQADGVPGLTQHAIKPGEEFIYEFTAAPAGTRFYHTHGSDHTTSAQQLDMGLSGPLIVEPKSGAIAYDSEYTLVLDEWDIRESGANGAIAHVHGSGEAGVIPEFNTFTINGRAFPDIPAINLRKGESVLIRFINAGTAESHPMHLHGHNFAVVARDGNLLPKAAREIRNTVAIAPGETLDILVDANNPGPWVLHCHHIHHAAAGMAILFKYEGHEPLAPNEL